MFNPTADGFTRLEAALRKPIENSARQQLRCLVERYCTRIDEATNSAPLRKAMADVERATSAVISKLNEIGSPTVAVLNAGLKHRVFSRRGAASAIPDSLVKVSLISGLLSDLRLACRKSAPDLLLSQEEIDWIEDEIARSRRPKRGTKPYPGCPLEPFERLIIELTTWARSADLPFGISNAGAAKHQSGSEGFLESPFSVFVGRLLSLLQQKYLPPGWRDADGEARQKRIQRARRKARLQYFPLKKDAMDEAQVGLGKRFRRPSRGQ